jgi:CheY-like chemotaxis protein
MEYSGRELIHNRRSVLYKFSMKHSPVFMLVEDNEGDIRFTQEIFKDAKINGPLMIVRNGENAIAYIKGDGKYADRNQFPIPRLILLDINLGALSGLEVLEWIRQQSKFDDINIIVLTTSGNVPEIKKAYQLGANSFLTKPLTERALLDYIGSMKSFSRSAHQEDGATA